MEVPQEVQAAKVKGIALLNSSEFHKALQEFHACLDTSVDEIFRSHIYAFLAICYGSLQDTSNALTAVNMSIILNDKLVVGIFNL